MELTDTSAGLLAQVFPALLIAILLEGRLARRKNRSRRALRNLMLLRLAAVIMSVGGTFMCTLVVITGDSNWFTDVWVTCTLFIVFAGTLALCAEVFDKELLSLGEQPVVVPYAASTAADVKKRSERGRRNP